MFEVKSEDGRARAGLFRVRAGTVATPFFMPVLTCSSLTRFGTEEYWRLGAHTEACHFAGTSAAICNSLIASFTPGIDAVVRGHGVHELLEFHRPLFTDSGGYQVSPESSFVARVEEEGIVFAARWCNSVSLLTPAESMRIQRAMGSDVAMVLDDMAGAGESRERHILALERTHRWAESCLLHHSDTDQMLFGICQGGTYEDLRRRSAAHIGALGFAGVAIGGIALEPSRALRLRSVRAAMQCMPAEKLRYVMGIGNPVDILSMVMEGVDCFDAAFPTIQARRGLCLTDRGMLGTEDLKSALNSGERSSGCACRMCSLTESAELMQSADSDEWFGLLAKHNLQFMERFMSDVRTAIRGRYFAQYCDEFLAKWTNVPVRGQARHPQ